MPVVTIKIKGNLDEHWSEWFSGCTLTHSGANETILEGEVQDQPAVYGLITRLRDLGLSLVEVYIEERPNQIPTILS